jgi:type II secretory pathway pseudopilin PulG
MRLQTNRFRISGLTLMELVVVVAILAFLAGMVSFNLTPNQLTFGGAGGNKTAGRIATEATMKEVRDAIFGRDGSPGYWQDMNRDLLFWPSKLDWLSRPPIDSVVLDSNTEPEFRAYFENMMAYDFGKRVGWRGPYLRYSGVIVPNDSDRGFGAHYGGNGELRSPADAWGNPIVMQYPEPSGGPVLDFQAARLDSAFAVFLVQNSRLVSAGPDGILDTEKHKSVLRTYDDFIQYAALVGDDVVLWLSRW